MPDWQRAREEQAHARAEAAKQLNQKLGLGKSEREIEKHANERATAAAERALRDRKGA